MKVPVFVALSFLGVPASSVVAQPAPERPFGTLREQAAMQQGWLKKRLDTLLPALMRKHGIDMWVVPMREYNEDPVFVAIRRRETFAARRRTIYVFFDRCAATGAAPSPAVVERIALGGTSQGGVFEAAPRSTKAAAGDVGRGQQAELWGDEQWQALKTVIEERKPDRSSASIARPCSRSPTACRAASSRACATALGANWTSRFKDAEGAAARADRRRGCPRRRPSTRRMQELVWG